MNARRPRITLATRFDLCAFGDQQTGAGALLVILGHQLIGDVARLRAALAPLAPQIERALVFGSMASGSAHAGSDVDLLVVGSASFAQVVEATYAAQAPLGCDINPKVMTADEWAAKQLEGNPFVQELLAKPQILLIGTLHA